MVERMRCCVPAKCSVSLVALHVGNVSERHMASIIAGRMRAKQEAMFVRRVETCVLQGERVCA